MDIPVEAVAMRKANSRREIADLDCSRSVRNR